MCRQRYLFCLSLALVASASDISGDLKEGSKKKEDDRSALLPTLKPESDKKFFGKDYPWDKRPRVDVLHFKHPYPVVQDSDEFDKDFVKDENSDNGEYKAQTEYDRLRHKLAKEKADIRRALAAKNQAEKDLQDAMRREADAKKRLKIAPKKKQKHGSVEGSEGTAEEKVHVEVKKKEKEPTPYQPTPGGVASPGEVAVATDDTQKAMDHLEECKKELAAARERLKKLMKELEEAKQRQRETQAALDAALARQKALERDQGLLDDEVKKEYKEYMDAREAYLKQQALVAKMEQDIKEAAAKVKAMRDAEDKSGGVYNTHDSAAWSCFPPLAVFALVAFTTATLSIY